MIGTTTDHRLTQHSADSPAEPSSGTTAAALGPFLAQGRRRWLQRARWRRLARLPALDLPAVLDVAGALDSAIGDRLLTPGARWWLRTPRAFRCLTGFDSATAWKRFLTLVEGMAEHSR